MRNTWVTADTHFGHYNLVHKICDRPYKTIEEMDEDIIEKWNSVVHPGDVVYHLGDFSFKPCALYADRLHGQIQLIKGNHDREKDSVYRDYFSWVGHYKNIKVQGQKACLFHYSITSWQGKHYGSWNLFGHTHNSITPQIGQCDVGVDGWGFYPVSFDQLVCYFENQERIIEELQLNPFPCNDYKCTKCEENKG